MFFCKSRRVDWSNERYVRLYTRDSVTWSLLSWEAQALLCFLLRKVDRAGVMDLGGNEPARAAAAVVRMPLDVVERALPELTAAGVFEISETAMVMPNYIEAQEAKSSDKQRQSESRGRRRDRARAGADVTQRDTSSQPVTRGHDVSHDVTPSLAKPSQAEPSCTERESPAKPATRAKRPKKPRTPKPPTPQEIEIAQHLYDSIISHSPHLFADESPAETQRTLTTWCKSIKTAMNKGMTVESARLCIDYAHHPSDPSRSADGSFSWWGNLLSGSSLLKQWKQKKLYADATAWAKRGSQHKATGQRTEEDRARVRKIHEWLQA